MDRDCFICRSAGLNLMSELLNSPSSVLQKNARCG
jgi:hypothetical protein